MSRLEWLNWAAILWIILSFAATVQARAQPGVVSVGGSVTEIVYALGEGERLVARDTTSTFPDAVSELPDVGYKRRLSPEGVLAFAPDMVLIEDGSGPVEALEVLQSASVQVVSVPEEFSAAGVLDKIRVVGAALGATAAAQDLAAKVEAQLAEATAIAAQHEGPAKRVLFVLSAQGGRIMASGTGTAADAMIALAGGVNAIASFDGYKPLSQEALSAAAPDVILMMDRSGTHDATAETLFALPALSLTPAAETQALIRMDGLKLLGFGPRTAEAVMTLSQALYPR